MKRPHSNTLPGPPRHGFSLIEVVVSALLTGTILVAALRTGGAVLRMRSASSDQARAALLATDLIAEIRTMAWADPTTPTNFGRESGETTRAHFDDVDDYHNWTETPPVSREGTTIPGTSTWSRACQVVLVSRSNPLQTVSTSEGLKRVTVNVSRNGTLLKSLTTLVGEP